MGWKSTAKPDYSIVIGWCSGITTSFASTVLERKVSVFYVVLILLQCDCLVIFMILQNSEHDEGFLLTDSGSTPEEPVNFESAREELFRNKMSDPATASLFHALESQYHEEKQRECLRFTNAICCDQRNRKACNGCSSRCPVDCIGQMYLVFVTTLLYELAIFEMRGYFRWLAHALTFAWNWIAFVSLRLLWRLGSNGTSLRIFPLNNLSKSLAGCTVQLPHLYCALLTFTHGWGKNDYFPLSSARPRPCCTQIRLKVTYFRMSTKTYLLQICLKASSFYTASCRFFWNI